MAKQHEDMKTDIGALDKGIVDKIVSEVYLHSFYNSYAAFTQKNKIKSMNTVHESTWDRQFDVIIKRQQAREQAFLNGLGFKSVEDLQSKMIEIDSDMVSSGGLNDNQRNPLVDIWYESLSNAFEKLDKFYTSGKDLRQTVAEVEKIFDNMAKEYNEESGAYKGIQETKKSIISKLNKKTYDEWLKEVDEGGYFDRLSNTVSGDYLEHGLAKSLSTLAKINKKIVDIEVIGGPDTNLRTATKKQPKTDVKVTIGGVDYGIQAKRYSEKQGEDIVISWFKKDGKDSTYNLNGRTVDEVLSYFNFSNIEDQKLLSTDLKAIQAVAKNIQKNKALHYQLVNEYFLSEYGQTYEGVPNQGIHTDTLNDLLSFLMKTLPYFMGSQMTIDPDINVDFFNINGRFVPVSKILTSVFKATGKNKGASYEMTLYLNKAPDAKRLLTEKRKKSIPGDVYTEDRIAYGAKKGQELYNKMRVGSAHLKLGYDYIRGF